MIYNLSRPIYDGMPVYPGDPPVQITPLSIPPWQISALRLGSHSGTHLDAPRHRFADGSGIDAIPLAQLIRPGLVIDARGHAANAPIEPTILTGHDLWPGMALVIRTGWEDYWGEERYFHHPYLSNALAQALVNRQIALVAIDALSVDSSVSGHDDAHVTLLGAGIVIAENLCNLAALTPGQRYTFAFLPIAIANGDAAPARALAWDTLTL